MTYIYQLRDPRDWRIRYVGRTTQPSKRLRGHLYTHKRTAHTRHDRWIECLKRDGVQPKLELVEIVPGYGYEEERKWVAILRREGCDLVNGNDGGCGAKPGYERRVPRVIPPEVRERISNTLKGRRIGFAVRPPTREEREKAFEIRRGRPVGPSSEEKKRKSRESNLRAWSNPELKAKHSTAVSVGVKRWHERRRNAT